MEQNEKKFMDFINKEKVFENFGCGKLADIAYQVFERVPEDARKEDADKAILRSLHDELTYYGDQWEVIAFYSSPEEPMRLSDACDQFFVDLMRCID